jgi:hypothetical protein
MRRLAAAAVLLFAAAPLFAGEKALMIEKGTVTFTPRGDQKEIPAIYRLEAHRFDYELTPKRELPVSGVEVYELRFRSPVDSPHKENNTVYAEYYRARRRRPVRRRA